MGRYNVIEKPGNAILKFKYSKRIDPKTGKEEEPRQKREREPTCHWIKGESHLGCRAAVREFGVEVKRTMMQLQAENYDADKCAARTVKTALVRGLAGSFRKHRD